MSEREREIDRTSVREKWLERERESILASYQAYKHWTLLRLAAQRVYK